MGVLEPMGAKLEAKTSEVFKTSEVLNKRTSSYFYNQSGAGCAVNRVPLDISVQECCTKDGSRPTTVAVQAEAVNRLSVLVQ